MIKQGLFAFLVLAVLGVFVFFNFQGVQYSPPLEDALIGHFKFEKGAKDSSETRNRGVVHGAVSVEGIRKQALFFDGVDDYVSIPSDTAYSFSKEEGEAFSIALLPDTQHYSIYYKGFRSCFNEKFPNIYKAQTKWIKKHRDSHNIKFVLHLGDLVQQGEDPSGYEWDTAVGSMNVLEKANIPYGVIPGNHDYANSCNSHENVKNSDNYNLQIQFPEYNHHLKFYLVI